MEEKCNEQEILLFTLQQTKLVWKDVFQWSEKFAEMFFTTFRT